MKRLTLVGVGLATFLGAGLTLTEPASAQISCRVARGIAVIPRCAIGRPICIRTIPCRASLGRTLRVCTRYACIRRYDL